MEKDVPEVRPKDRTLEDHVEEFEGRGGFAVDENDCLSCCEVLRKKSKKSWGEAGVVKFREE